MIKSPRIRILFLTLYFGLFIRSTICIADDRKNNTCENDSDCAALPDIQPGCYYYCEGDACKKTDLGTCEVFNKIKRSSELTITCLPRRSCEKPLKIFCKNNVCTSYNRENEPDLTDFSKKYFELIPKAEIANPYFGNDTYGKPKVSTFKAKDGTVLLIFQARYGGDGDNTENQLKLFKFTNDVPKKLLDQNIDFVKFIEKDQTLKFINGKTIETLCDVCDGWEVSEKNDIFQIPVSIDVDSLKVKVDLSSAKKQKILNTLKHQVNIRIKEESKYETSENYSKYAKEVESRIEKLLTEK